MRRRNRSQCGTPVPPASPDYQRLLIVVVLVIVVMGNARPEVDDLVSIMTTLIAGLCALSARWAVPRPVTAR